MKLSRVVYCGFVLIGVLLLTAAAPTPDPTPTPSPQPTPPAPGDAVYVGSLGAVVPQPGETVEAYADFADGSSQRLVVETLDDGTVLIDPPDPASSGPAAPLGTGECNDNYSSADSLPAWCTTMNWWFKSGSTPAYLTVSGVVTDLRAALNNITHEINNCGRADTIDATASYQGTSSTSANINSSGVCLTRDTYSLVDFGTLPSTWIAATCNWSSGGSRVESDIRMNKINFTWTTGETCPSPSSTAYYVEGIMTHERGHTWNANDFPSGHPNQTMGGANGQCPGADAKSTLGLVDMLTIESRY